MRFEQSPYNFPPPTESPTEVTRLTRLVRWLTSRPVLLSLAGILVAVALVYLWTGWLPWYLVRPPAKVLPPSTYVPPPTPVVAEQGKLATGFPKELILDDKARLDNGFSVSVASSTSQYTASFTSSMTMSALFTLYKGYFTKNGWTITNEVAKYATSRGLYAKKDAAEASVAIIDLIKNRQVIVNYLGVGQ